LPFKPAAFDLIHQRDASLTLPFTKWQPLLREFQRMLKPGGWIELAEADSLLRSVGPAGERVNAWMLLAAGRRGIDMAVPRDLAVMCKDVGFVDIKLQRYATPVGDWGGTPGMYLAAGYRETLVGIKGWLVREKATTDQDFEHVMSQWEEELRQARTKTVYVV
ncbi:hypothetical protein BJ684DRAFT_5126, partial [Piptocephalis cylindrospora]